MKIDVKSKDSLYININGWTYYIDDSTDEQIIQKWKDETKELHITENFWNIDYIKELVKEC
tara:strand:- start:308 stop:490 length:183 start_codon:yes stop_codon:yes gene_type:complete